MKRGQSRQDTLLEIMSVNLKSSFLYPVRFGSPAIVLRHMLPAVSEVFACEISDDAVQLLFKNNQSSMPHMVLRDIALVEEGEVAFDYVSGETRSGPDLPIDLCISGFPCQANSLLNNNRWSRDAANTEEAQVLLEILRVMESVLRPTIFILENVGGLMKKRGGGNNASVLTWAEEQIKLRMPDYDFFSTQLGSSPLHLGRNPCRTHAL